MATEPVPEADAQEQSIPVDGPEEPGLAELPPDVSEADALDQARPPVDAPGSGDDIPPDVSEADALDQRRPAVNEEDEDRR